MERKIDMKSKHFDAFDGLRCIACILVLASHVGVLSQGGFANRIFFVLSGFLCVRFGHEEVFLSVREILYYYFKKVIRIIPSFYLILFSVQFFTRMFSKQEIIDNMFFVKSTSVWWFLQQTVVFYLFVPLIHYVIVIVKKVLHSINGYDKKNNCIIIAGCIFILSFFFSRKPLFYLYGNGKYIGFALDMFLIGIGCRYVYEYIIAHDLNITKFRSNILDFIEIVMLSSFLFTSCDVLQYVIDSSYSEYYIGWQHPYLCAIISSILILALAINKNGCIAKLLSNRCFVIIGKVSLLMYLSHIFMIPYISLGNKYLVLIYLIIECFSVSYIIYNVYEQPVNKKLNILLDKVLKKY